MPLRCYNCGQEWQGEPKPGFRALCTRCEAYIRCCWNCRFHDRTASSGCQLSNTETVREKDRPNFCEEFQFVERPAEWSPEAEKKKAESAREKFGRLFKKP